MIWLLRRQRAIQAKVRSTIHRLGSTTKPLASTGRKASPGENGDVESFNSRFRQELLDRELFLSLEDARWFIDRWRLDYNHHRPHSSLGYVPPAELAVR